MARYRNVVVLIPGILGSALEGPDGTSLWGTSPGAILRNVATLGSRLKALELVGDDPDIDELDDGIKVTGPITDLHLIPGLWKIDGYTKIRSTLVERLDLVPGRNFFEFAYDWRRDNRVAARALERKARRWLADWRSSSGNHDARLVLIAHSMGGLVARHFLEVLEGWRDTELLATFGTPYRGAPQALGALANGQVLFKVADVTALVRSMTSVYQLLPVYASYVGDDFVATRLGEGPSIPNLSTERLEAARSFHDRIRDAQAANAGIAAYARDFRVLPFIGSEQPTFNFARAAPEGVELLRRHKGLDHRGDGTVPRVSALPGEKPNDESAFFIADRHASLQNSDAALTHLCASLQGASIDYQAFREGTLATIGLDIEDAYPSDEAIEIKTSCSAYYQSLQFTIADTETGSVVEGTLWNSGGKEFRGEVELPPGVYRIRVAGDGASAVTDIFSVF